MLIWQDFPLENKSKKSSLEIMTRLEAAGRVVPKAGKGVSPHLARLGDVLGC
tara:strand:- start:688 stop:843 length:156 start_codon:yes stop_codon:yes gene_type:complete